MVTFKTLQDIKQKGLLQFEKQVTFFLFVMFSPLCAENDDLCVARFHRWRGKYWDMIPGDPAKDLFSLKENINGEMTFLTREIAFPVKLQCNCLLLKENS